MSPNKHLPANIIQFETTPEPEVQCSVRIHDYALAKNDYPETIPAVKPYIASDIPTNSILPYLNDIVEQIEIQKKVLDCGNKESTNRVLQKASILIKQHILEIEVKKEAIQTLLNAVNDILDEIASGKRK